MPSEPATKMVVPIRLFAKTLCQDETEADRLVMETLQAAIQRPEQVAGNNTQIHLLSIMRKLYTRALSKDASNVNKRAEHLDCSCHSDCMCSNVNGRFGKTGMHWAEAAIRALPLPLREAAILVIVLNHNVREAAMVIGADEETVSQRADQAKRLLIQMLL